MRMRKNSEDGHMCGRNVLVTIIHFMRLINVWNIGSTNLN